MTKEPQLLVRFRGPGNRYQVTEDYRVVQKGDRLILEILDKDALGAPTWVSTPFKRVIDHFEWSKRWGKSWKACATRVDYSTSILDTSKAAPALPPQYHGLVVCSTSRCDHAADDEDQDVYTVATSRAPDYLTEVKHLVRAVGEDARPIAFGALVILALYEVSQ